MYGMLVHRQWTSVMAQPDAALVLPARHPCCWPLARYKLFTVGFDTYCACREFGHIDASDYLRQRRPEEAGDDPDRQDEHVDHTKRGRNSVAERTRTPSSR